MTLLEHIKEAGFPYWQETIHLFVGGSALHGAKVDGYDDLDICGVFIEPPDKILGVDDYPHFDWSTSGNERKNTSDDVDIVLYGLRKWANLACKGNPSILHFLFAENQLEQEPAKDTWFHAVMSQRQRFLCQNHHKQFLGFASAQLMRMTGMKSRNVTRQDLVDAHGFDTKFAMHVIRLLVECEELMRTGVISLPSIEKELLIDIRTGKYEEMWVIEEANRRMQLCKNAAEHSVLPKEVDRNAISKIIAEAYRMHWQKWRM